MAANRSVSEVSECLAPKSFRVAETRTGFDPDPFCAAGRTFEYIMLETSASSSFRFRNRFSADRGWLMRSDVSGSILSGKMKMKIEIEIELFLFLPRARFFKALRAN
jgi:hypothetical protein